MQKGDIYEASEDFQILVTTAHSQSASLRLRPGESSSEQANAHKRSDQVVLVVRGEIIAEVDGVHTRLTAGETATIHAGIPHRLLNEGDENALVFSTYAPPAYPAEEKGAGLTNRPEAELLDLTPAFPAVAIPAQ